MAHYNDKKMLDHVDQKELRRPDDEQLPVPKVRFEMIRDLVCLHVLKLNRADFGLQLPDGSHHPNQCPVGLVLAVGPDVKHLKPGDWTVASYETPLVKLMHNGDKYYVTKEENLMTRLLPGEEGILRKEHAIVDPR
jgi:hypothetical protein